MSRRQNEKYHQWRERKAKAERAGKPRFLDQKIETALSYIGAKTRGIEQITRHFPKDSRELVSPFLGAGSLEIAMLNRGWTVYGSDLAEPVAIFWKCLIRDGRRVHEMVQELCQVGEEATPNAFAELRRIMWASEETDWRRAAACFLVSKFSYLGSVFKGGSSPGNKLREAHLRKLLILHYHLQHDRRFEFRRVPWREALDGYPDKFAYLDPPYPTKEHYYPQTIDHQELRDYLAGRPRWIMSNADNEVVRDLYRGFQMVRPQWKYGGGTVGRGRNSKEVLIFSRDLEPVDWSYLADTSAQ
jgi:DNA adenine methylase